MENINLKNQFSGPALEFIQIETGFKLLLKNL